MYTLVGLVVAGGLVYWLGRRSIILAIMASMVGAVFAIVGLADGLEAAALVATPLFLMGAAVVYLLRRQARQRLAVPKPG